MRKDEKREKSEYLEERKKHCHEKLADENRLK
jgi:hypothetical protein